MPAAKKKLARDSSTGQTVTPAYAKANPKTTTVETIKPLGTLILKNIYKPLKKLPKTLAQTADAAYALRDARLLLQRVVDLMQKDETALKEHLIQNLPKSQASGVSGKFANAKIEKVDEPTISDRAKLQAYLKKSGEFDLVSMRVNAKAVRERWDNKKKVPGVDAFTVVKVSLTKI